MRGSRPLYPASRLKREIPEMLAEDMTLEEIAKVYGVHRLTMQSWCRKFKIKTRWGNRRQRYHGAEQRILVLQYLKDGLKQVQIAKLMKLTPGQISHYVTDLLRSGLVSRPSYGKVVVTKKWSLRGNDAT